MIKNLLYSAFVHIILLSIVYLSFTSENKIDLNSQEFLISAIIVETKAKKVNIPEKEPKKEKIKKPEKPKKAKKTKVAKKPKVIKPIIKAKEKHIEKPKIKPRPKPKPKKKIVKKALKKVKVRPTHTFNPENDIENLNLSAREKFNLKTQFKRCYLWASKESNYKNKIKIKFTINISSYGLIESNIAKITDKDKYKQNLDYKKSIDNAARTIQLCNPIRNLPQNKFDIFRNINIEIGQ